MKRDIHKITLSAINSALIVVIILLGTFIELLDITTAALCSLLVFAVMIEAKGKYPILVYLTSSTLLLIFVPLSSATLYFIGFFGYYPIIRNALVKKKKTIRKIICLVIFNVAMSILMLLFKAVFALQNEPLAMYALLIATCNISSFALIIFRMFSLLFILKKYATRLSL